MAKLLKPGHPVAIKKGIYFTFLPLKKTAKTICFRLEGVKASSTNSRKIDDSYMGKPATPFHQGRQHVQAHKSWIPWIHFLKVVTNFDHHSNSKCWYISIKRLPSHRG